MSEEAQFEMLVHVYLAQRHATRALEWAGGPGVDIDTARDLQDIQADCADIIGRASEEVQERAMLHVLAGA